MEHPHPEHRVPQPADTDGDTAGRGGGLPQNSATEKQRHSAVASTHETRVGSRDGQDDALVAAVAAVIADSLSSDTGTRQAAQPEPQQRPAQMDPSGSGLGKDLSSVSTGNTAEKEEEEEEEEEEEDAIDLALASAVAGTHHAAQVLRNDDSIIAHSSVSHCASDPVETKEVADTDTPPTAAPSPPSPDEDRHKPGAGGNDNDDGDGDDEDDSSPKARNAIKHHHTEGRAGWGESQAAVVVAEADLEFAAMAEGGSVSTS